MTPVQAISTCLRRYTTFSGRASRAEYWLFGLFVALAGQAAGWVDLWITHLSNGWTIHTLQRVELAQSFTRGLYIFLMQPMGYFPESGYLPINAWMGGYSFLSPQFGIAQMMVFLAFVIPTVSATCRRARDADQSVALVLTLCFWSAIFIGMHNLLFVISEALNSVAIRSFLQGFSGPIISVLWPFSKATALCALYFLVLPSKFGSVPSTSELTGPLQAHVSSNPAEQASREIVLPTPTNQLPGPNPHEVTP